MSDGLSGLVHEQRPRWQKLRQYLLKFAVGLHVGDAIRRSWLRLQECKLVAEALFSIGKKFSRFCLKVIPASSGRPATATRREPMLRSDSASACTLGQGVGWRGNVGFARPRFG